MGKLAKAAQSQTMRRMDGPSGGIQQLLQNNWEQIRSIMPRHMSSERLFQISLSAINHTPELMEATPETLLSCVMKCAALGLEPSAVDGLGRAYILPYRNRKAGIVEAQFILGYKGIIDLARRSGEIKSIHAQAVYQGDEFDCWEDETGQHFTFRPGRDNPHTPENLTDVYVCAQLKDGGMVFERMTKAEVDAIRGRSRASQRGPWVTDFEAMALKTVIRRSARYLPMSVQAQEAVASDEQTPDYSGLFHPVVPADSVEAEPEQPHGPTDEEKAEMRSLTDGCVAAGHDGGVTARRIYDAYIGGGMDAARAEASAVMATDPATGEVELADDDIDF